MPAPAKAPNRNLILIIGVGIVLLFFVINDVLGWINGGGIFSVVSAIHDARRRQPHIQVDDAALRTCFVGMCSLAGTLLSLNFKIDWTKRATSAALMFAVIGGGFALDAVLGSRIADFFMTSRGYSRCSRFDQARGSGKGRVWFHGYALPGMCPNEARGR